MKIKAFLTNLLRRSRSFQRHKKQAQTLMQRVRDRDEAHKNLREKLIGMLDGDIEQAEKLVARQRFGKDGLYSENYCYWLAIRELEEKQERQTD